MAKLRVAFDSSLGANQPCLSRHLLQRVLVLRFEKFLLSFRVGPVLVTRVYIQFTMVLSIWRRCLVLGEAGCGLAVNISLQGFASGLPPP